MKFFRHDPKEVARVIAEKVAKWERERHRDAAQRTQEAQYLAAAEEEALRASQTRGEAIPFIYQDVPEGPPHPQILDLLNPDPLDRNELDNLLMAGDALVEWALEERDRRKGDRTEETTGTPSWCLVCGRRAADSRNWREHGVGCPVGLWFSTKTNILNELNRENDRKKQAGAHRSNSIHIISV